MNIVEYVSGARRYKATLVPGKHIIVEFFRDDQFVSMRKFEVGDEAEYDSFNLHYTGQIVSIGKATVTIKNSWGDRRRLKAQDFSWRNWDFNAAEIARRNAETSQHI